MKRYDRLLVLVPLLMLLVIIVTDVLLLNRDRRGRQYLVDVNRIEQTLLQGGEPDAADYPSVTGITEYDGSAAFYESESEYLIREINGKLYRFDYTENSVRNSKLIVIVDIMLTLS